MIKSFHNICQFLLAPLMQELLILDASNTLDLHRLNVQRPNTMLPLWRLEKILHSAVKLSMDNANSKEIGVTRASWCNFIVYTKKGISVEMIAFDPTYLAELRQELASYYFAHFRKHASKAV